MITKVLSVSRIGNFVNYTLKKGSALDFRKLTLIYAENGSGKTTLSSIFRSLQTGEPAHIVSRKTLSKDQEILDGDVAVAILLNGSHKAEFKDGQWNGQFPHFAIFDAHFVNNNVFSGNLVEHDHKKSLYHFVIGEDGLTLTKEYNELATQHKESVAAVAEAEKKVLSCIGGQMPPKEFLKLKPTEKIDAAIAEKEQQIDSLKKIGDLKTKPAPTEISIPAVALADVSALLGKRMEDISAAAAAQVQAHIVAHLGAGGESWLAQGVGYLKDDQCPFCRESLASSEIVKHYQGYFSTAYSDFKKEIAAFGATVDHSFDKSLKLVPLTRQLTANESLADFWAGHLAIERLANLSQEIDTQWNAMSALLQAHVGRKLAAPLDPIAVDDDLLFAIVEWQALTQMVTEYNAQVRAIALAVAEKKRELGGIDLQTAQAEHRLLTITKARFEPAAVAACKEYLDADEERKRLDKEKKAAKQALDDYTAEVFAKYQTRINEHLAGFGARFKITATDTSFAGGKQPSSTYDIEINGQAVSLGNVRENPNLPSFGNTLSEGDKSTLAFAFFLARLELDPYLGEKVVIIDDPISSLDTNRKNKTQQQICRLMGQVKQVVLQSHDPYFLKLVYDDPRSVDCRLLAIAKRPDGSVLQEWEIEQDTLHDYYKHFFVLKSFLEEGKGDLNHVASCLRLYLEGNLRYRYPAHFGPSEWLGACVEKLRGVTEPSHDLWPLRHFLDDLSDITSYSSPSHHAGSPRPITAGELTVYVRRALELGKSA